MASTASSRPPVRNKQSILDEHEGIADSQTDARNAPNNLAQAPGISLNSGQLAEIRELIEKTVAEKLSAVASQAAKTDVDLALGQSPATSSS